MKTKNNSKRKISGAIENSSRNKTDKIFSWVGKEKYFFQKHNFGSSVVYII